MKKDGGPAFPFEGPQEYYDGMSLRDYFAIHALPAIARTFDILAQQGKSSMLSFELSAQTITKAAYEVADTMLKEREKE